MMIRSSTIRTISIFSFVDVQCLLAGVLFLLANIMDMIHMITFTIQSKFNYYDMIQLNTKSIIEQWMYRILTMNNNYTITILYCISYIMIIIPIIKISLLQSNYFTHTSTKHILIIVLVIITSLIEIITKLLLLGTQTGMSWMVQGFQLTNWSQEDTYITDNNTTSNVYRLDSSSNTHAMSYDPSTGSNSTSATGSTNSITYPLLDTIGWKTIEVINNSINSMSLWIDTTQRLLLSIIFVLIYMSLCDSRRRNTNNGSKQQVQFNFVWGKLGLLISFFCILNVIGDIVQFQSWYSKYYINDILFYISLINRLFCIPLWFTWLSFQLPIIEQQQYQSSYQCINDNNYNNHNNKNNRTTQTYALSAHAPDCDDDDYDHDDNNNEYNERYNENENPGVYNDNIFNTKNNEYDQYGFASKYFVPSTILKSKSKSNKQKHNQYLTTVTNIHPNGSGIV